MRDLAPKNVALNVQVLDGGDAQALARGWQPDSQTLLKDIVCIQALSTCWAEPRDQ